MTNNSPMKIFIEASKHPPENWDDSVRDCNGTLYHTAGWSRYVCASQSNVQPHFLRFRNDFGNTACVLMFVRRSSHPILQHLGGEAWVDACPAIKGIDDPRLVHAVLDRLEQFAKSVSAINLRIGSYESQDIEPALSALGYRIERRLEFAFDLGRSEEDLFRTLDDTRRNTIRKAIRSGVTVETLAGEPAIAILRRLQSESSRRIVSRGGDALSLEQDDPIGLLLEAGLATIWGARVDGQIESAALFSSFNRSAYQMRAGHSEKGFKAQAATLMIWEATKYYRSKGARFLNLGGCKASAAEEGSPEHGVYLFKKRFSTVCLPCADGSKVIGGGFHRGIRKLKALMVR